LEAIFLKSLKMVDFFGDRKEKRLAAFSLKKKFLKHEAVIIFLKLF
jgi:hypothetical protein